jgi:hypothetical protein
MAAKDAEVAFAEAEGLEEGYTLDDRNQWVLAKQRERDALAAAYARIIESDEMPEIDIELHCMFGCYLMDCPRHQRL